MNSNEIKKILRDKFLISEKAWKLSTLGYASMFLIKNDKVQSFTVPRPRVNVVPRENNNDEDEKKR